jgi:hypothetical protein
MAIASHSPSPPPRHRRRLPRRRWPRSSCVTRARPGTSLRRWVAVEEEGRRTALGVDLDPLGSSTEKKKEASICAFTHPSRDLWEAEEEQHCTVGFIPASCSSSAPPDLWSGGGLWATSPGVNASQRSSTSITFFPFKVNRDKNPNPNS